MGTIKTPRYTRPKKLADGSIGWFWTLPTWAQPKKSKDGQLVPVERHGAACPLESSPLGTDAAKAWDRANEINEALDRWRKGQDQSKLIERGTVSWLMAWFRQQKQFTGRKNKTKADYRKIMKIVEGFPMKSGGKLGDRRIALVDAPFVDKLYEKLREQRGDRQATYCMQVCRRAWNLAMRPGYDKITGVYFNPFAKMGLSSTAKSGNRATSREEYNLYRETARKLGFQSMATAAAIAFELVNRSWDVFGFSDDDGNEAVGALWIGYRAGHSFTIQLSKNKAENEPHIKTIPLIDVDSSGKIIPLYPELEEELARTARSHDRIVVEERNRLPYKERHMSNVHRKICDAAGLPKDMTFTGFRHGGATEIGDAGESDTRPISGHKKLETTAIYNKVTQVKAVAIGRARRKFIDDNVVMDKIEES